VGRIEREELRRGRHESPVARFAAQRRGELAPLLEVPITDHHPTVGLLETEFHRLHESRADLGGELESIRYHRNGLPARRCRTVDRSGLVETDHPVAHHRPLKSLRQQRFRPAVQRSRGRNGQRIADQEQGAVRPGLAGLPPDRLRCLLHHLLATVGTDDTSRPRKQHTEMVTDLRDRAHGTPTAPDGIPLLDGDGGADAVDPVHVRFRQSFQELAGVGGE